MTSRSRWSRGSVSSWRCVATGLICFIDARTVEAVRGQRVVLTITARDTRARSASDRRTVVAR